MATQRLVVGQREALDARPVWRPDEIAVMNFRGARNVMLDVSDVLVALLVGHNGAGKTSTLQAIEWALTGDVLRGGTREVQDFYTPENGSTPLVSLRLRDATGAIAGGEPDGSLWLRRSLGNGHKLQVGGHEAGARDAADVLRMAVGWEKDVVQKLLWADTFVNLRPTAQQQFLLDLTARAGQQQVSLAALAADDVQRALAEELTANLTITGPDAVQVAIERAQERHKQAGVRVAEREAAVERAQGALQEALAEFAEAGYEADTLDDLERQIDEAAAALRQQLAEARPQAEARQQIMATIEAQSVALEQAQADLEAARAEQAEANARREQVETQRVQAQADVEAARAEVERARARLQAAVANARAAQQAEVARLSDSLQAAKDAREREAAALEARHIALLDARDAVGRERAAADGRRLAAKERLDQIAALDATQGCPLCNRPLTPDECDELRVQAESTWATADDEYRTLDGLHDAAERAVREHQQARRARLAELDAAVAEADAELTSAQQRVTACPEEDQAVEAAEAALQRAQAALQEITELPDPDALAAVVARASARATEAAGAVADAQAALDAIPADITETVETLTSALENTQVLTEALRRARHYAQVLAEAQTGAQEARAERLAAARLKAAWQTLLGEMLGSSDAIRPVLDDVSAVLRPVRDWLADWSADGPVVIGRGWQRAFDRLSDGERLTAGAAWQVALAPRTGLGIALVDHTAEVDDDALVDFLHALRDMASRVGMLFVVARPAVPETALGDGIAVYRLHEGVLA
ncbi:MAG: AAA family ATPase [Armatimonadota bacterium]